MSEQKNMSVFTTRKDTPYLVDEELAQLLLESRPEPRTQDVITECARVFETMSIRTAGSEAPDHDQR